MKHKLILKDIFSDDINIPLEEWNPRNEDVNILLSIDVTFTGYEECVTYFYCKLYTPEALLLRVKNKNTSEILIKHRALVISSFDFNLLKETINNILDECTRETDGETYLALGRYFQWEYEDFNVLTEAQKKDLELFYKLNPPDE
jgi:hypothetical protein